MKTKMKNKIEFKFHGMEQKWNGKKEEHIILSIEFGNVKKLIQIRVRDEE